MRASPRDPGKGAGRGRAPTATRHPRTVPARGRARCSAPRPQGGGSAYFVLAGLVSPLHRGQGLTGSSQQLKSSNVKDSEGVSAMGMGLGRVTTSVGQVRGARARALGAPAAPRRARLSLYSPALPRPHLHDSRLRVRRAVSCSLVNVIKQLLCQTRALFLKSPAESSPCVGTTRRNDIAIGTRIPRV